ncbi:MAG: aminotransferase class V-fold PLP-dependent enzyme [Bacteroidetes bacterium]|nr:MAG: aminotransferase class V-fold PLP-dependent enzyme [Bacteroidota bacterium]
MEETYWDEIREEFPVTQNLAYFQSAGMSPMPKRVLQAITEAYTKLSHFGDMYFLEDITRSDKLREKLAKMINTSASNICFAHNTSTAFNFIAAALKRGTPFDFNLVSLMDEFPSSHIPFEFQGIPVKFVKPVNGLYSIESIIDAVDEKTMGVVCSHVQYSTGFRLDVEKLGKTLNEMDLLFIVNATQAFPIYEVDVEKMHIDVLAVSFHKWGLCGVAGTLFYTSEGFRKMYPNPMAGWLAVKPPSDDFIPTQKNTEYEQFEHAGQYNFGTMNFQALAGLDAAIDFINEVGREKIRERISYLSGYLIEGLKRLPVDILSPVENHATRSAIVLINLKKADNAGAVSFLQKQGIVAAVRAGNLRIACNFFNNTEEIDRLVNALALFCEMET